MSAARDGTGVRGRWPAAVWRSAWLDALDAPARAQLEAAGVLRTFRRGERVFAVGEHADAFFVVAAGLVDVHVVRRGDTETTTLRRAVTGDALGLEAIVHPGARRTAQATCATQTVLAEVPVAPFRRLAGRTDGSHAARLEAAIRRSAARDVLRASSLARAVSERELDALVETAEHRSLARGEALFERGDRARHAFVVAEGMLQAQTDDDGRPRVRAYLARGDLVIDAAFESGGVHEITVTASGPALVLAIDRAALLAATRAAPEALARARRLVSSPPLPESTRHVLGDLWRFAVAGSMLVIDDEACVRCGHCSWSCAQAHDDGISRLVRRGEKVVVRDAIDGSSRALVVPGSCQHCKHPACMIECPTGAIARDPHGQVLVREELCVGCGQCAKACPWGTVQMAPRVAEAKRRLPLAPAGEVAVKCDLCAGVGGGPACVAACPVDAIARIEPRAAIAEVRGAVATRVARRPLPRRRRAWPWVAGAAFVAVATARVLPSTVASRPFTGVLAGGLLALLAAYALIKRTRLGRRGDGRTSALRPHAVAHLAIGMLSMGIVVAHAGARAPANAAGALLVAVLVAAVSGGAAALTYALVPRALARVERRTRLPEDLPARARDLDERTFGALTGRSDETKAAFSRVLAPYARAPLGALTLVLRANTLRDEEDRLRQLVQRALGAPAARLDGLDALVRLAVEQRATRAQRLLQRVLRAWLPVHVIAATVAIVLLVVHVVCVVRGP